LAPLRCVWSLGAVFSPSFKSDDTEKKEDLFIMIFLQQISSLFITRILTVLLLTATVVSVSTSAFAYGVKECSGDRFGEDLVCTAGDVSITGIAVAPGTPTSCVGGTTFNADLDITVNFATPDRWDIGIFLSNDGKDPQLTTTGGGSSACSVGILPTSSPFLDLDPNGGLDTCGDGNGSINGNTAQGIVRLYDVPVACQAIADSGGGLYIPFVVSWDNQASPTGDDCASILDPVPNTKSKCNAPDVTNPVEVLYGTVDAIVLPDITKTDGVTAVDPSDSLTYTVVITNTTGQPLDGAVFTDPATANLNITNVTCSASGGVTCPTTTITDMQGSGITLPLMPIGSVLTFSIDATVADPVSPSYSNIITNTANVIVKSEINSATDINDINGAIYSDLSTSTKEVDDLNGGEADPGDVLRYTITLNETAGLAVSGVSVTDDMPPYTNTFTVRSTPSGSIDSSTGTGTGSNNTGYLDVTGISIAANSSETIVFDVTIANGTPAGTTIDNIATVNNPSGPGGTPFSPTITVSPSDVPLTDNKKLYINSTSPNTLSRNPPSGSPASITFSKAAPVIWTGNSPTSLQLDNTIQSAYATLFLTADSAQVRQVEARMYCSSDDSAYATSGFYDLTPPESPLPPDPFAFNLTTRVGGFTFPATCAAPNHWVLRVDSNTGKNVTVYPVSGVDNSRLNLDSSNIIYVENLEFYDAPYPGGTAIATAAAGTTIYIRSVVSDPFGSFDITAESINISDPGGTPVVTAAAMNEVNDSGVATKTYEYAYAVPGGASSGNWSVTVTANEGSEGTVTDDRTSAFEVVAVFPSLTFLKSSRTYRDPVNDTTNPKAIPGAELRYTMQVTNFGFGSTDTDTLVFIDPIPADTILYVGDLGQGSPVYFSDLASSGYTVADVKVSYSSSTDCIDFSYTPVPDANDYDSDICQLQVQMDGAINVSDGITNPSFSLEFQAKIK
jgi:uncharacterized repeat protein (TIGR01451 family)